MGDLNPVTLVKKVMKINPIQLVKKFKPIDFVSDVVGTAGLGIIDLKKGRFYVPLSSGALRNFAKSVGNVATLGVIRKDINHFGDSSMARTGGAIASALAMTLAGGAIASSMMAPAAATTAAGTAGTTSGTIVGTGGAVAPLAAGASSAGTGTLGTLGVTAATGLVGSKLAGGMTSPSTMAPTADFSGELSSKVGGLNNTDTRGWFSTLSPGTQAAMITGGLTVAQMATGAMSGIFQGVSAQKKLELEQLINSQSQTQRQRLNTNNEYAPKVEFRPQPGMVGSA